MDRNWKITTVTFVGYCTYVKTIVSHVMQLKIVLWMCKGGYNKKTNIEYTCI